MKKIRGVWICLILLLLIGCNGDQETPAPTISPLESPLTQPSPLPSPTSTIMVLVQPEVAPPASGKGSAVGRLVDYETGQTTTEPIPLYLGTLVPMEPGDAFIISMSPTKAPSTLMREDGYFVFSDVEPGEYALVFWTPVSTWVLNDPETQETIMVTFEAGEITEVGELEVDLPDF